jgi:hypothetical protein
VKRNRIVQILLVILLVQVLSLTTIHSTLLANENDTSNASAAEAEELAARSLDYIRACDWGSFAATMHPEALSSFHNIFITLAEKDTTGAVNQIFFGGRKLSEIHALTPAETFVSILDGMMMLMPPMKEAFRSADMTILGTVTENDLFHVVYRMKMKVLEVKASKVAVLSMKPYEGELRNLLTADMEEMVQKIRQMSR